MLHKKTVIKQFLTYACGSVLLRSVNVLLAPLVMRIVSPTDYGLLALAYNFISVCTVITGFGLRQLFGIEFFHHTGPDRYRMANDIILVYCTLAIPLFALSILAIPLLNTYVFINYGSTSLIAICLISCFCYFFTELFYQVLLYQGRALLLTSIQIGTALGTIALNLFFLLALKLPIISLLISQLIGMFVVCSIGLYWYIKNNAHMHINILSARTRASYYLKQGFPFMPGMLAAWLLSSGNRWMLARFAQLHDVGIYAIADTFGQLFNMVVLYPMGGSYIPLMLKQLTEHKQNSAVIEQQNDRMMWYSMIGMGTLITIGYLISKPLLLMVFPPQYHTAIPYIPGILIGYVFLMGTYFSTISLQFRKRTHFLALALVIPSLLNVGLDILFIPTYGIYGCVCATALAYAIYFALTLWYSHYVRAQTTLHPAYKIDAIHADIHADNQVCASTPPQQKAPEHSSNMQ